MAEPKPEIDDTQLSAALKRLGGAIEADPKNHESEPPPTVKLYQLPL